MSEQTMNDLFVRSIATSTPRFDTSRQTTAHIRPQDHVLILHLVFLIMAVATMITCVIIVVVVLRRNFQVRTKDAANKVLLADDSSLTECSADEDWDNALPVMVWDLSKNRKICRSRPIDHWGSADHAMETGDANSDCTTTLFEDSRGFGSFIWSDNSTNSVDEDDDDESVSGHTVDLIRAGVFKRTFCILKEQPRCVLCSVCYVVGDKLSVSNNQSCNHQFHQGCMLQWLKRKSEKCPVCKEKYILGTQ